MRIELLDHQGRDAVPLAWLRRVACCAAARLGIRQAGRLSVVFLDRATMRALNRRFARHDRLTDVLSFRYPGEPIIGEILVAPASARLYARAHRRSYRDELARYVIHGLLHWVGHDDKTPAQQRKMRAMEDRLLAQCAR